MNSSSSPAAMIIRSVFSLCVWQRRGERGEFKRGIGERTRRLPHRSPGQGLQVVPFDCFLACEPPASRASALPGREAGRGGGGVSPAAVRVRGARAAVPAGRSFEQSRINGSTSAVQSSSGEEQGQPSTPALFLLAHCLTRRAGCCSPVCSLDGVLNPSSGLPLLPTCISPSETSSLAIRTSA